MAQYEQTSYTNNDIKLFLLNEFKDENNKDKLNYIIQDILEANYYNKLSQRTYSQFYHKKLVDTITYRLKKPITYKHSKDHYTDAF